jgi:hypothetical protein
MTRAPGITAPEGSFTEPAILPTPAVCACTDRSQINIVKKTKLKNHRTRLTVRFFIEEFSFQESLTDTRTFES